MAEKDILIRERQNILVFLITLKLILISLNGLKMINIWLLRRNIMKKLRLMGKKLQLNGKQGESLQITSFSK